MKNTRRSSRTTKMEIEAMIAASASPPAFETSGVLIRDTWRCFFPATKTPQRLSSARSEYF